MEPPTLPTGLGGPETPPEPSGAAIGPTAARPAPAPKPGNLIGIAVLSLSGAVVGILVFIAASGDPLSTYVGACCGVGGISLFAFSLVAYNAFRRRAAMAAAAGGAPVAEVARGEEWVCGACGADLRPDAKFCAKCGEPVEE